MPKKQSETSVVTPEATISFPHLYKTWAGPEGTNVPKYSGIFIFAPGTDLTLLKRAAIVAAKKKWGDKAEQMIRNGQLRMPFREDGESKGYPKGAIFITARSEQAPGVVSRYADPVTNQPANIPEEEGTKIGHPNEIYSGCRVRGLVGAFGYDKSGNKGVAFALNGVQKIADGERMDNRVAAADAFEAELADVPQSYEDLMDKSYEDLMGETS